MTVMRRRGTSTRLQFYEEKQFDVAIISIGGAIAAWTLIFNSFFDVGDFRAHSWFIFVSSMLSMFHIGLFAAYVDYELARPVYYGRRFGKPRSWLQLCFVVIVFALPAIASYYLPWYVWWRLVLYKTSFWQEFKPFLILVVAGLINIVLLTRCIAYYLSSRGKRLILLSSTAKSIILWFKRIILLPSTGERIFLGCLVAVAFGWVVVLGLAWLVTDERGPTGPQTHKPFVQSSLHRAPLFSGSSLTLGTLF